MFNPPITGNKDLDAYLYDVHTNLVDATNGTAEVTPDIPGGDPATYPYQYLQIKYGDDNVGTGFSNTPTNKTYFGLHNSNTPTESTNPADYTWYLSATPFGTTQFLYYLILGGRKIKFAVNNALPDYKWKIDSGTAVDLDVLVPPFTISADEILANAVTELKIANNAVTATKITVAALDQIFGNLNPNTVTATQIAENAVTELKILNSSITDAKIVANTITGSKIAAETIGAQAIAAGAITAVKIDAGAVTADKILAGSVTAAKINVNELAAISTVTGNLTVGSTGFLRGGQTDFNTGTGFFLGYSSTTYKFSIGNSTSNILWNGSALEINGASIRVGTGGSPGSSAFYVSTTGVVYVDNIFGGVGLFDNTRYSGNNGLYSATWQAREAIYGQVVTSNSSGNAHGVRGINSYNGASGLVGVANGYDFYADGSGTNYGPFTGNHDFLIPVGQTLEPGDLVADVTCVARNGWSNAIFQVEKSSQPNQAGVRGVFIGELRPLSSVQPPVFIDHWEEHEHASIAVMTAQYEAIKDSYLFGSMSSLGEGQMQVCGENGNISIDTLLVSSSTAGVAMAQSDDIIRGKTIAKAREAVTFTSPTEIKQVACIYISG
jgi:hypothetical protein